MKNQIPLLTASKIKKTGITVILALFLIGFGGCNRQLLNEETNGKNSEAVTNEPEQIEAGVDSNDTNNEAADEAFVMRPEVAALPTEPFLLSPEYFDEPLFELIEKDVPEEDLEYSHITMSSEEYEKIKDEVEPLDDLEEDGVVYLRLREQDMGKVRGKVKFVETSSINKEFKISNPIWYVTNLIEFYNRICYVGKSELLNQPEINSEYNPDKYSWIVPQQLRPISIPKNKEGVYIAKINKNHPEYASISKNGIIELTNEEAELNYIWASEYDINRAEQRGIILWSERSKIILFKIFSLVFTAPREFLIQENCLSEHSEVFDSSLISDSIHLRAYVYIPDSMKPENIQTEITEFAQLLHDPISEKNDPDDDKMNHVIIGDWEKFKSLEGNGNIYRFNILRLHGRQLINLVRHPNIMYLDYDWGDSIHI